MLLTLNILVGANERVVKHHCLPFSAFQMNKRTFADNEVLIEVELLTKNLTQQRWELTNIHLGREDWPSSLSDITFLCCYCAIDIV